MPKTTKTKSPPAKTLLGREKQMVALAVDLAERQLREGTAPASVITHYLKLGASSYELERQKLQYETELIQAKTANIKSQAHMEEIYDEALAMLRVYTGAYDA